MVCPHGSHTVHAIATARVCTLVACTLLTVACARHRYARARAEAEAEVEKRRVEKVELEAAIKEVQSTLQKSLEVAADSMIDKVNALASSATPAHLTRSDTGIQVRPSSLPSPHHLLVTSHYLPFTSPAISVCLLPPSPTFSHLLPPSPTFSRRLMRADTALYRMTNGRTTTRCRM